MKRKAYLLLLLVLVVALLFTGCDSSDYKKAMEMYENGEYADAAPIFEGLGDYEDSAEMAKVCNYEVAKTLLADGSFDEAKAAFAELGDYEDSANYVMECDYSKAAALLESGDYEGAIALFDTIKDFKDSADKIKEANKAIMLEKFGDVIKALSGNTWYFNGGEKTILNGISFSEDEATIAQVSFDGNGKHDNGSNSFDYVVDENNITLTLADGSEMQIPYSLSDKGIKLNNDEYFSEKDIEKGIQGYWKITSGFGSLETERNIYFKDGKVKAEWASEAMGGFGYYYYGPDSGSYKLNFGGFDTDMRHGSEYFFNIIDGKVTILHYDTVGKPSDGFPGEDGYKF